MNIKLNGKPFSTSCRKMNDLISEYNPNTKNAVTIINGFQTNNNVEIHENDEVVIIEKGKMPEKDEFEAMLSARHTPKVYECVKKAKVAVAGLGGLGSNIAIMLARTGVGQLHLIDFDVVEPSNLNRQQYFIDDLSLNKTSAVKRQIKRINPYIKIICDCVKVDENNCVDLFKNDEIVCEAFDNPDSKALLVNQLLEKTDCKIVAASGMAGFEKSNTIVTRKISDRFYLCGDGVTEAKQGCGLMAPRVNICAAHQANAVLRIILNEFDV